MVEEISNFFTIEMIYLWLNIGVLPIWLILIFFPQSKTCRYFITSIIPYFLFAAVYLYLIYIFYISGYDFLNNFILYTSLNNLIQLFSDKSFLIIFWIHFVAINLFCASWMVRDSQKLMISRFLVSIPILTTYFVGPIGLVIYWLIRIFFAKKIVLYD